MTDRLRWKPSLREHGRDRPLLRDPLRLGLLVGALVMAIGAFLPWAEGMIGFLRVQFGGFEGASDGLILVTFGLVVMFIARDRESLDASEGPRRWAPMLIGLVCVAVWLVAGRSAEITTPADVGTEPGSGQYRSSSAGSAARSSAPSSVSLIS